MSSRPPSGSMVYWRRKSGGGDWKFGYVTYIAGGYDKLRMGRWNGDDTGGSIVSTSDIDWTPYTGSLRG